VGSTLASARSLSSADDGAHTIRLTASANGQLFTNQFTLTVTSNPIAEWTLTQASVSGTTVADASGNGHVATVVNGPLTFGALGANFNGAQYLDATLPATVQGSVLTTFTLVNDTGNTLPAGSPVSFGQGFRYGDVMPGAYPLIRDATTHVALSGQQWDEVARFVENGGNSSWRHAVWAAWLPNSLANGATYQVEFVSTTGTYSQSSHQALSALCSGAAAHDLKIFLTDVRNQDDTVRNTGNAAFRLCDNIANTGRDSPRHLRAGNVYDEYVVSGMFYYTASPKQNPAGGQADPLLYAQCIVDIFTNASDGTSPGDVRWVCHVHNSWENVAAGSIGNTGNPGPAGFTKDPQAVSYRTEIDDGASDVLDWSGLDATVASTSNPIVSASSNGCNRAGETVCLNVPSSTGANAWYYGMPTRVSSTGTPVAGLTNGQLYYIWPSGSVAANANTNTQFVSLMKTPGATDPFSMTSSQGTGTTTFTTHQTHYHFETWQTLDWTGLLNWAPFGTTTRVTRKVYPALTTAEKLYWEESGVIIPLYLSQSPGNLGPAYSSGRGNNYEPFGTLNVIGGGGTGPRPDLGISNEWAAKAFITQAQLDWDLERLFTLGTTVLGYSTMLDESTGRISALNNGPPTGPGGSGSGGTYAGLGALRNQIQWIGCCAFPGGNGYADPDHTDPATAPSDIAFGTLNNTGIDHMPSFDGFSYIVFGERQFLDMMQWHGNRDFAQQRPGPGPNLGQGYFRDNNATGPDGLTHHYWGLTTVCCQGRGAAWLTRDVLYPAAFGQDPSVAYPDGTKNSERAYFHDMITETGNYWPLFLKFRDGPGSTGYSASVYPPNEPDTVGGAGFMSGFVTAYTGSVAYLAETWMHEPVLGSQWNSKLQRYYEGICGGQLPGNVPDYYCTEETLDPYVHDGGAIPGSYQGNIGQYLNGVDASDFGSNDAFMNILAGGQMAAQEYIFTAGDTMRMTYNGWDGGAIDPYTPIDQLPGTRRAVIMGPIDNTPAYRTYYIQCNAADHASWPTQCPVAGQAFTGFTRGGVPITTPENNHDPSYRLQYDPGGNVGHRNVNYSQYTGQMINSLMALGFSVGHAMTNYVFRCGPQALGAGCYSSSLPSNWWDGTVVVPGLPAPVNTVP
jgi:hypothetical protein